VNQENKHIIDDLKVTPIQMPSDSYFEELKKSILNEIGNDVPSATGMKKDTPRIIPMYRRWYVWGSAAAILAFAILLPWSTTNSPKESEGINLSSVSNEEIYDYLNENIEDLDTETIAVHLSSDAITQKGNQEAENDVAGTRGNFSSKSTLLDHVEDQEILDYLKDESGELDEYLLIES